MDTRFTFIKEERLSSQKDIDFLFENGSSFISYPLRIIFKERDSDSSSLPSILVSVSKKRFKRAVKRNRIKRLIRETYRLNKNELTEFLVLKKKNLLIAFLYVSNDLLEYPEIDKSMKKAIEILKNRLS